MKNMPLVNFHGGESVTVLKINEPEYTLDRYLSLGIYEGARLTVFMKAAKHHCKSRQYKNCLHRQICRKRNLP